ncbi:Bug family tripartite tricarboxylate transporter substrate binding protein [Faunimonas sp. B44]|uniref:Bug family tripartite tricarboxylate transporter substrate binding protein n=1 Tax=Faunimonas sp. B44 TaxID=3461493 RepID=UPI004043FBF4
MTLAAVLSLSGIRAATAQGWPERAVTLVVPFAAGGGADPLARIVADGLSKKLGQPVVLDFRPGANGTVGTNIVAHAAPDGYTLVFTSPAPLVNVRFRANLSYDPAKDLTYIAQIADAPFMITASSKFGPTTLSELVDHAKAHPEAVNAGMSGFGGAGHLSLAILEHATGIKLTMVPYNGVGERIADLMAGTIDISTGIGASGFLPGIEDGSLKGIVVMGDTRLPELPDVPTVVEAGFPDAVASGWYMIAGPKGISQDVVDTINTAVVEYLDDEATKDKVIGIGNMVKTGSPADALALVERETNVIKALIDAGRFSVE